MVDLLEPRTRFIPESLNRPVVFQAQDEVPFVIPAVLPPRLVLNLHPKPTDTKMGDVEITIRVEPRTPTDTPRLETYYGLIIDFDQEKGEVEGHIRGEGDNKTYFLQKDGRTRLWLDMPNEVWDNKVSLDEVHPVFSDIIRRSLASYQYSLEKGQNDEDLVHIDLGDADMWGFLRNRSSVPKNRLAILDRAA